MRQHALGDAKELRRRPTDRMATALGRYRRGGRRMRVLRRTAAVTLLVTAAVLASSGQSPAADGTPVVVAGRDMDVGATLARQDLRTSSVRVPPGGAVAGIPQAAGRVLAAPVRRGEILTDVRLLDTSGPRAGAGRVAVPVRIDQSGVADLLRPGVHVALVAVSGDGNGGADGGVGRGAVRVLTDDAVLLSTADPMGGPLSGVNRDRVLVVAVPTASADAVAAAGLTGDIAVRFR